VLELARKYLTRGWRIIPVPFRQKGPIIDEWQKLRIEADDLPRYFRGRCNIGILLGEPSGGLVDVDLDHPLAVELAPQFLPMTNCVFGREGKPRSHLIYQSSGAVTHQRTTGKLAGMLVELRSTGVQTVFPGSVHESGEPIEWAEDGEPAAVDHAALRVAVDALADEVERRLGIRQDDELSDDAVLPDTTGWKIEGDESYGLKPGADFNARGDLREVLRRNGWTLIRKTDRDELWRRPGKTHGVSASLRDGKAFYCFTSSTGIPSSIESKRGYSPFAVLTYLEHDGDFSAAAKALAKAGWGDSATSNAQSAPHKSNGKPKGCDGRQLATPIIINLSTVTPEPVRWLWPGRIALGKLTILCGEPGLGKSFTTLDIASRVTRGTPWPDDPFGPNQAGSVVLLSAEDDLADTIRPRLDQARADVKRVVALQGIEFKLDDSTPAKRRCFNLEHDLPALETAITSLSDTSLVVIDPISSYLGGTDSHKNAEIRGLLAPLAELASRHHVAVLAVTHLNKNAGSKAMHRVTGSLAFIAAARAGWLVTADKNSPTRRLFLPVKNNLAADMGGLAFAIIDGAVAWERGPVSLSADDALDADQRKDGKTQRDDAADWLRELLSDGPMRRKDVGDAAEANGVSPATLRRAKTKAGVISKKHGNGKDAYWEWRLSDQRCAEDVEDAHPQEVSAFDTFGENEHLPPPPGEEVGEL
jgi:AAA domain/Bifunctional DNA primase/polymerase, N-terminal